jgi:hypothetical protein
MMAARSFSRRAAEAIVADCTVDTVGNDGAWPLFCETRRLSVGYVQAEGLTYRTNVDYASDLVDARDGDPRAWAARVLLAAQQIEAMLPYMGSSDGNWPSDSRLQRTAAAADPQSRYATQVSTYASSSAWAKLLVMAKAPTAHDPATPLAPIQHHKSRSSARRRRRG